MIYYDLKNKLRAYMLDVNLKSVPEHLRDIAKRAKAKRLGHNLTQKELAARGGISLASLKRFESSGRIALKSLLQIALVLDSLPDFEGLFQENPNIDLFAPEPKKRFRGSGSRTGRKT